MACFSGEALAVIGCLCRGQDMPFRTHHRRFCCVHGAASPDQCKLLCSPFVLSLKQPSRPLRELDQLLVASCMFIMLQGPTAAGWHHLRAFQWQNHCRHKACVLCEY